MGPSASWNSTSDSEKRVSLQRRGRADGNALLQPSFLLILQELTTLARKGLTLESTPECILNRGTTKVVMQTAKIGQVAKETGLSIDTIRFYEKEGLLKRSSRTEGGFRLFGSGEIQALKFIRKSQQLGFSLGEIRELLVLRGDQVPACVHVQQLLEQKLAAVAQRIEELRALESNLEVALRKCNRMLKTGQASHEGRCPVLEEIKLDVGA